MDVLPALRGSHLIDPGVHVIDHVRYLMGRPRPVSVFGTAYSGFGKREKLKDKPGYIERGAGDDPHTVRDTATALIPFDRAFVSLLQDFFKKLQKK